MRSAIPCRSALLLVLKPNNTRGPPMPNCTVEPLDLGKVGRRVIEAAFDGGDIVSDGGVLLLRQVDQRIGLTRAIARVFEDRRRPASGAARLTHLLAQRRHRV